MSSNGQPDDEAAMRAVRAALDGDDPAAAVAEAADSPPAGQAATGHAPAAPRTAPQLRVVAPAADAAAPDPDPAELPDPVESPDTTHAIPPAPRRAAAPGGVHGRRPTAAGTAAPPPADGDSEAVATLLREAADMAEAGDGGEPGGAPGPDAPPRPRPGARLAAEWARWRPLRPFLVATLAPVPFLILASTLGGVFSLMAFLWMTGVLYAIDEVLKRQGVAGPEPARAEMADALSVLLGLVHFGLLLLAAWALSGAAGLGLFSWLATFLAFGLWFGQVSNSNAHELIHRTDPRLFRLGMWVYISLLFGHHTSAHRLVHHRFVATTDDPNTAAEGEGFWLFAARAWPGAFVAGYEMEEHRRAGREVGGLRGMNPYTIYVAGGIVFVAGVLTLFGFDGLIAYLLLCAHAQMQLLLADYVQHYGLLRRKLPSGALEPAGARHSWDAPHPFSGLMMLNAPRHADHHAHPARRWPELRLSPRGRAPLLPYSLPVMAAIAMVPPAWHRVMARRLARVRAAA